MRQEVLVTAIDELIDLYSLVSQAGKVRLQMSNIGVTAIGHELGISANHMRLYRLEELSQPSREVQQLIDEGQIEVVIEQEEGPGPVFWDAENLSGWIRRP